MKIVMLELRNNSWRQYCCEF